MSLPKENPVTSKGNEIESIQSKDEDQSSSRRSGRQRTVSKRLQDMETDFAYGGKKSSKRVADAGQIETTSPKKRQKSGLQKDSPAKGSEPNSQQSIPTSNSKMTATKSKISILKVPKGVTGKVNHDLQLKKPDTQIPLILSEESSTAQFQIIENVGMNRLEIDPNRIENETRENVEAVQKLIAIAEGSNDNVPQQRIEENILHREDAEIINNVEERESQNAVESLVESRRFEPEITSNEPRTLSLLEKAMTLAGPTPRCFEENIPSQQECIENEKDSCENKLERNSPQPRKNEDISNEEGENVENANNLMPHIEETATGTILLEDGRKIIFETIPLSTDNCENGEIPTIKEGENDTAVKIKIISLGTGETIQSAVHRLQNVSPPKPSLQTSRNCISNPPTVISETGVYSCSLCNYKTEKKANWYKHRYTHSGKRCYQCETCNYKAKSSSNLKRHMLIHSDVRSFTCSQCRKTFRQKIHLERHIKYKHEEKSIQCQFCDYICANLSPDLKIHMQRKHPMLEYWGENIAAPQFTCETCGFIAASKRDLKQHQKFHLPGPELKLFCEYCSFVTNCPSRLKRHLFVHSKEKPYKCELCEYRGSQKEHVYRHIRTIHKMIPADEVNKGLVQIDKDGQLYALSQSLESTETEHSEHSHLDESEISQNSNLEGEPSQNSNSDDEESTESYNLENRDMENENNLGNNSKDLPQNSQDMLEGKSSDALPIGGQADVADKDILDVKSEINSSQCNEEKTSKISHQGNLNPSSDGQINETTFNPAIHESTQYIAVNPNTSHQAEHQANAREIDQNVTYVQNISNMISSEQNTAEESSILVRAPQQLRPDLPLNMPQPVKKKYKPADFSHKDKVFSCNHCTMKFAKMINLYKHVSVQHKDVPRTQSDGVHSCVWCDYQTNKWKNLLVHMRKHNTKDASQDGTSGNLYKCVVCNYTNSRRRTLYTHMMRKHRIHIKIQPNGTSNCVIDNNLLMEPEKEDLISSSKIIVQHPGHIQTQTPILTTETGGQILGVETTSGEEGEQKKMVMLELEPGMSAMAVEISAPKRSTIPIGMDEEAADAIQGLQALAGQVVEQIDMGQGVEGHVIVQGDVTGEGQVIIGQGQGIGELIEGGVIGGQGMGQIHIVEGKGIETETGGYIEDEAGGQIGSNIELTAEQLMQLSSGDYIEINGEMYKVEVSEDPPELAAHAN